MSPEIINHLDNLMLSPCEKWKLTNQAVLDDSVPCPCCENFSDLISSGSWEAVHLLYQHLIIGNYLFPQKHNY